MEASERNDQRPLRCTACGYIVTRIVWDSVPFNSTIRCCKSTNLQPYEVNMDASDPRARAWSTRRERYGQQGHSHVAYSSRGPGKTIGMLALKLVIRLHREGTLSEGQCCKALDLDRVHFRTLVDGAEL